MNNLTILISFLFITMFSALVKAQEPTSFKSGETVYGALADERGPIGGGTGYRGIITRGNFIVKSLEELIDALDRVHSGDTIFIPGETEIDLTTFIYIDELVLEIPAGVTLAGERGNNNSMGALLSSDVLNTPEMIRTGGADVRITGLRIQGPCPKRYLDHHKRAFGPGGKGADYYYKFPTSNGITTMFPHLEVDNCEISAFAHSGIYLRQGDDHHIHHNYIHHCQYNGLGYGISHKKASSLTEYNLFNWNRHSIAGTGQPGCSYVARNNVEMGESLSHCFDMHGGRDRKDGTNIAGTAIAIYNNTFRAREPAVRIRGVPVIKCEVHHNWFLQFDQPAKAVRAEENTIVIDNIYGAEPKIIP
jgi:hypothetical protein